MEQETVYSSELPSIEELVTASRLKLPSGQAIQSSWMRDMLSEEIWIPWIEG